MRIWPRRTPPPDPGPAIQAEEHAAARKELERLAKEMSGKPEPDLIIGRSDQRRRRPRAGR